MTSADPVAAGLRWAGLCVRVERAAAGGRRLLPIATGVALAAAALATAGPSVFAGPLRWVLAAAGAAVAAAMVLGFLQRVGPARAARALDGWRGLPDSMLALVESAGGAVTASPAWREAIARDARDRLLASRLVRAPLMTGAPALPAAVAGVFFVCALVGIPRGGGVPAREVPASRPLHADGIAQVMAIWRENARGATGSVAQALTAAAAELDAAMGRPEAPPAEAMIAAGRAEDLLASAAGMARDAANASAALSEALAGAGGSGADGTGPGAAPYDDPARRAAIEELARLAENAGLAGITAKLEGVFSAATPEAGQGAIKGLLAALRRASEESLDEAGALALALAQLAAAREALPGPRGVLPEPAQDFPGVGEGAGADSGEVRRGAQASGIEPGTSGSAAGTVNPGGRFSVGRVPSGEGPSGSRRIAAGDSRAAAGALSRLAVETEPLPLARRATVRRYFDALHNSKP